MTHQQALLRLQEKRQRGKELRRVLAALEDHLKTRARVWNDLGNLLNDPGCLSFVVGDDASVRIYNRHRPFTPPGIPGMKPRPEDDFELVTSFNKSSFDSESLTSALQQLHAGSERKDLEKHSQEPGDPL
jgi:hypothetical protein